MTLFPSLSPLGERRQARLADARLQAVVTTRRAEGDLEAFLASLFAGSVDICRLRDDTATEDELRAAADTFRRACDRAGGLFIVDRLPGLAVQVGADGVHVGLVDVDPDHARRVVGPDLLVGRTVRTPADIDAAADEDVDYLVVEPVSDKAVGHYASKRASHPWFLSGSVGTDTVDAALDAGARRIVADSCLATAEDPEGVCWDLRRALARRAGG
ncbi:MAG: thiamine phosphate synthase [Nitriliruptorales bacterium]